LPRLAWTTILLFYISWCNWDDRCTQPCPAFSVEVVGLQNFFAWADLKPVQCLLLFTLLSATQRWGAEAILPLIRHFERNTLDIGLISLYALTATSTFQVYTEPPDLGPGTGVHACNLSYLRDRDRKVMVWD
jgi:hypothetical protein